VSVVQAAGVPVNAAIGNNVAGNRFVGDKTNTWSIKAVGEAGEVQKTIHAVVRADGALGKLVYWREE
jgi:general secretion pathway protein K